MASLAIVWNFFEKQWTKNHPQYLSGLSRALFPTTFLEIAVYRPLFPILLEKATTSNSCHYTNSVKNNTVVNASKSINLGRYFEWMPKLQTLVKKHNKEEQKTRPQDL